LLGGVVMVLSVFFMFSMFSSFSVGSFLTVSACFAVGISCCFFTMTVEIPFKLFTRETLNIEIIFLKVWWRI
jgi:hypothetical protein